MSQRWSAARQWIIKKRLVYVPFWFLFFIPFSLLVRVRGTKHFPSSGAVIIANHEAYTDPLILICAFPWKKNFRFIAKPSLQSIRHVYREENGDAQQPLIVRVIRYIQYSISLFYTHYTDSIIIKPGQSTTQRAIAALREHTRYIVGIFPAGVRRKRMRGTSIAPRKGFIVIAREAHVPVIPVALYKKGWFWRVHIMPPIPPERLDDETYGTTDEERACAIMQRHINAALPPQYRVRYAAKGTS